MVDGGHGHAIAEVMEAVFAGNVRSQSEAFGGKVFQRKDPL